MNWILVYSRIICMLSVYTWYAVGGSMPVMDTTEIHMNISVGKTVILPCMVHGLPPTNDYMVIWNSPSRRPISYNKRVLMGRRFQIVQPYITEWNLKISPSQPGDSGEYLCQLNTDPLQQKSVHLTVQVPPRIISSKDVDIIEGKQLSIYCNVTGRPRPTLTWFKDDILLPHHKDEVLKFNSVSKNVSGSYKCVASNGKDSDKAVISVNVLYAPEVYVKSDRIGQLQRKQAVLECHSSAYPPGELVWKKGDKIISKSTWQYEVQIFDGKHPNERALNLMIRSLDSTDYGEYVCEAENSVGKDSVRMYLYEITTTGSYLSKSTDEPVIVTTPDSRGPDHVSVIVSYDSSTSSSTSSGKYISQGVTTASTPVMVVDSNKAPGNKSSQNHYTIYSVSIPVVTTFLHFYVSSCIYHINL